MKKIVLTFGLLSGAIMSAVMAVTSTSHDRIGFEAGMVIGYASMVAASLLIFAGVRRYRDTVGAGTIGFGRAFAVGALIAVVASACYTATWEVIYARIGPEFTAQYQRHALEKARREGANAAELERTRAEMERFAELYRNPAINAAITFVEPLPVGLLMALVSAAVMRRRERGGAAGLARAA